MQFSITDFEEIESYEPGCLTEQAKADGAKPRYFVPVHGQSKQTPSTSVDDLLREAENLLRSLRSEKAAAASGDVAEAAKDARVQAAYHLNQAGHLTRKQLDAELEAGLERTTKAAATEDALVSAVEEKWDGMSGDLKSQAAPSLARHYLRESGRKVKGD